MSRKFSKLFSGGKISIIRVGYINFLASPRNWSWYSITDNLIMTSFTFLKVWAKKGLEKLFVKPFQKKTFLSDRRPERFHLQDAVFSHRKQDFTTSSMALIRSRNVVPKVSYDLTRIYVKKQSYKMHGLEKGPLKYVSLTKRAATSYLNQMKTIRYMEAAGVAICRQKHKSINPTNLSLGQEGSHVGIRAAMRDCDQIITGKRSYGWLCLIQALIELSEPKLPKFSPLTKTIHLKRSGPKFFDGSGSAAAQVPVGAGVALANKYKSNCAACLILYNNDAAQQGQVYETLNMAKIWRLPCVFICESNSKNVRSAYCSEFYKTDDNIPGLSVDATNVIAVYNATKFAINYVLRRGPIILEMQTYTIDGNTSPNLFSISPATREIVQNYDDPILNFIQLCLKRRLLTFEEIRDIESNVQEKVDMAIEKFKNCEKFQLDKLTTNIFVNCLESPAHSLNLYSVIHGARNIISKTISTKCKGFYL